MDNIRLLKANLKDAIANDDLQLALTLAKQLGLSKRYICNIANVNVGNVVSYIKGRLPIKDTTKYKIYAVLEEVLNV